MVLDVRLDCLRIAINEDWIELEAKEENDTLVVRVRDGSKIIEPVRRHGRKDNAESSKSI